MAGPRVARLRKLLLLQWTCWIAALVAFVYLCDYLIDAYTRITKAPPCQWYAVPILNGIPYSSRYCCLSKKTILLRLYEEGDQLIAERTYPYSNLPRFIWWKNNLGYGAYPDDSFIVLPPTLIDRLRAKLP